VLLQSLQPVLSPLVRAWLMPVIPGTSPVSTMRRDWV
jgi:hypothetical protein